MSRAGTDLCLSAGVRRGFVAAVGLAVSLATTCVLLAIVAGPAQAGKVVDRIVAGTAASGTTGGLFNTPRGVAVNDPGVADGSGTDGWVYVADDANHRIQAFNAAGVFQFAIGRNVIKAAPAVNVDLGDVFEKCTHPADCQAGSPGTTADGPAGEFDNPQGVAINQTTGHVYVRDRDNRRVQEFDATGTFVRMWGQDVIIATGPPPNSNGTGFEVCDTTNGNTAAQCKQGTTGAAGGALATSSTASTGIAVMPPGAANAGNVFVVDPGNRRLQEFTSAGAFVRLWGWDVVATGQTGDLGTNAFEICSATTVGVCKAATTIGSVAGNVSGQFRTDQPRHLAADAVTGTVYTSNELVTQAGSGVGTAPPHPVQVFDSDAVTASDLLRPLLDVAAITGTFSQTQTSALAVDPSNGNLLVARAGTAVGVLEIAGASIGSPSHADTHYATANLAAAGVALNPSSGDLYATNAGADGHRLFAADSDGAGPASSSIGAVVGVEATTATLSGTVNPGGGSLSASYRFQYSADGINWVDATAPIDVGNGISDISVQASVSGLDPNTFYRARIVTQKQFGNALVPSPEQVFVTDSAPPEAITLPVGPRTDTTAQLRGSVDPNGTPTTYWFEYGGDTTYGKRVPLVPAPAGGGNEALLLVEDIAGLVPSTIYHYRIVADGSGPPVAGADQTFMTQPTSTAGAALGGRAFELVSPADKVAGIGVGPWYGGPGAASFAGMAAHEGERFAATGEFGSMLVEGAQAYVNDWAFAQRTDDKQGWVSRSPVTHAAPAAQDYRWIFMQAATPDFSRVVWRSNTALLRPFAEMAGWNGQMDTSFVGGWDGRWEIFGPTDPDTQRFDAGTGNRNWAVEVVLSADGSTMAGSTFQLRGLAGPGDPTLGLPTNESIRNVYVADVAGQLADSLPGTGQRVLASVCAGATTLPAVSGGDLSGQACVDGALVSARGATQQLSWAGDSSGLATSLDGVVSADGSRVFFMSPDPLAAGVPNGTSSFCTGTGAATVCPAQLFARHTRGDGDVVTRWISRSRSVDLGGGRFGGPPIAGQDATLTGQALFEGASEDGDKVFFRSNSPLTPDDPNGGAQVPGGVTSGSASGLSWDLFMYDFPDDPDADPADGTLIRVSAGPTGASDANNPQDSTYAQGSLRFVSKDGSRVYFVTAAPLAGVAPAADGTVTAPGGSASSTDQSNLYAFDSSATGSGRWRFVARLPRSIEQSAATCATTGVGRQPVLSATSAAATTNVSFSTAPRSNCVKGTDDGGFVTLFTDGGLTVDDPDGVSGDVYGYDAVRDELVRLTASQGGVGGSYPCGTGAEAATMPCYGDGGFGYYDPARRVPNPSLDVATNPDNAGDRIAFFQSRSRLVPQDTDQAYDVYQWRNGDLSLVTPGASPADHGQMYKGNDVSGRNVYFATLDRLSWQDSDSVLDVYTARIGGGIAEPDPPDLCAVLVGGCHSGGSAAVTPNVGSEAPTAGNQPTAARARLSIATPGLAARRRAARRGVLVLRVRSTASGRVTVVARGRIAGRVRRVGSGSVRLAGPSAATVRVRLNTAARGRLASGRAINLTVRVTAANVRARSIAVRLPGAGS